MGVDCWGDDSYGDLGDGTRTGDSSTPVAVSGISTAVAVGVGLDYACALLSGGTVECWGFNAGGELGESTKATEFESDVPVPVTGITDATAIGVGENSACAVLSDGQVQCWGQNAEGELGDGPFTGPETCTFSCSRTPVTVSDLSTAVRVSVGSQQACAILSDGNVECWGANYEGQLGNGTTTNSDVPVLAGPLVSAPPTPPPPAPAAPNSGSGATGATGTTGNSARFLCGCVHIVPRPISPRPISPTAAFALPLARQCVSHRKFTIHVRTLPGINWDQRSHQDQPQAREDHGTRSHHRAHEPRGPAEGHVRSFDHRQGEQRAISDRDADLPHLRSEKQKPLPGAETLGRSASRTNPTL